MRPSWVESANHPETDFPVENLPFGIYEGDGAGRIGLAIGDRILDLACCADMGLLERLPGSVVRACRRGGDLNQLAARGSAAGRQVRRRAAELLTNPEYREKLAPTMVAQKDVRMLPPFRVCDYTDFYASIHHATNVGRLFRPDNPLMPNYKYVPVGYHGRASSIVVSGETVRRPRGQVMSPEAAAPVYMPTRALDYELEMGIFVAEGNELGQPIPLERAEERMFGMCLVNDWSARDMQSWEYQPLGPFLAKSFATTVSPWVVMLDALAPFRAPAYARPEGDPAPLGYLSSEVDRERGGFDVQLEVWLWTARMRELDQPPARVSRGNLRTLYWTPAQMLTHQTSNGCNTRPGDLLATGTVSGAQADSVGCLLERTKRGAEPLELPNGERRGFLEDGDEVILRAWCEREGYSRIGFGECRGVVEAAG